MKSLEYFLSSAQKISKDDSPPERGLTVLVWAGEPIRLWQNGQPCDFIVYPIKDVYALTEEESDTLWKLARPDTQTFLIIQQESSQDIGVIKPSRFKDMRQTLRATYRGKGELGVDISPLPGAPDVDADIYACPDHPDQTKWAQPQKGYQPPKCPIDGKPREPLKRAQGS